MSSVTAKPLSEQTAPAPQRVVVVHADQRVRMVLGRLLSEDDRFSVAGQVDSVQEALSLTADFDVALVGLTVSGLGSPQGIVGLGQREPAPVVVILAPSAQAPFYLRCAALAEGAVGFLLIPEDVADLANRLATQAGPPLRLSNPVPSP